MSNSDRGDSLSISRLEWKLEKGAFIFNYKQKKVKEAQGERSRMAISVEAGEEMAMLRFAHGFRQ